MAAPGIPLYLLVERFQASVSAANLAQPFVCPNDYDVLGIYASCGTAPGGTSTVIINLSNSPTSQLSVVSPYSLWSTAKAPTIIGTSTKSYSAANVLIAVQNSAYALNYPLPGPAGTSGLVTAQQALPTTENPVLQAPSEIQPNVTALTAPDLTYSDINGFVRPTGRIRPGDVLTFAISGSIGSAANLAISLYLLKH